jgi:hypothetical protein
MGRHNIGVLLAIIAGLAAIGATIWPIVPQAQVRAGPFWGIAAFSSGVAFLIAAFIVDRLTVVSKALLVIGALVLVGSAAIFGGLFGGGRAPLAVVIDLAPAVVALVAAFLIGPIQKSPTELDHPPRRVSDPNA